MEVCSVFINQTDFLEVKQAIDQNLQHRAVDLCYLLEYAPIINYYITHMIIYKSDYLAHSAKFPRKFFCYI